MVCASRFGVNTINTIFPQVPTQINPFSSSINERIRLLNLYFLKVLLRGSYTLRPFEVPIQIRSSLDSIKAVFSRLLIDE